MRGGGGDGKDKEKDDRRSRADEAVLVWGKGVVSGNGDAQLCVSHAPWRPRVQYVTGR